MYILADFAKEEPRYNPKALRGSDKISKKHNVHPDDITIGFDHTDHPVFIGSDHINRQNHIYNHEGKHIKSVNYKD